MAAASSTQLARSTDLITRLIYTAPHTLAPCSDVDIVISGIATPSRLTGGFGQADKRFVAKVLERVAREVRRERRAGVSVHSRCSRCAQALGAAASSQQRRWRLAGAEGAFKQLATLTARPPAPLFTTLQLRKARRLDLRSLVIIRTARIPIIKLQTGPASGSVVADVSLGDEGGPAAARYVTQQIAAYPPLAPLVLVLKVRHVIVVELTQ